MPRPPETLLEKIGLIDEGMPDLHIIRLFSAYAAISNGQVIKVSEPSLECCPLARVLYRRQNPAVNQEVRQRIKSILEEKIWKYGHYTERREIIGRNIAIPFGASEIMMAAIQKGIIEAAVVVCDGAGTVITSCPEMVQGIGARMNALFYTTPIPGLIQRLEARSVCIPFPETGMIDQVEGVKTAARKGFKRIVVTVNSAMGDSFLALREAERELGVDVTILAVCTSGISDKRVKEIAENADLVWSCASGEVREIAGRKAIMQISVRIPVFVMTPKGLQLMRGYVQDPSDFNDVNTSNQYLVSSNGQGKRLKIAGMDYWLEQRPLPLRSDKEPKWKEKPENNN